jgi:hypothetical protein
VTAPAGLAIVGLVLNLAGAIGVARSRLVIDDTYGL